MRGIPSSILLGLVLCCGGAGAAAQDKEGGTVHVNGIRNPEMHTYRAIAAGLDTFDAEHTLAPGAPQLLFQARTRAGQPLGEALLKGAPGAGPLRAVLAGDGDYTLALALDGEGRFQVPRSQPAWDAHADLRLSKQRSDARVWPYVRSPGLLDNQRRLGDIRLECQVFVAIAKKEAPLHIVLLGNAVMLGSDWCAFMKDRDHAWDATTPAPLSSAILRDGQRSMALRVKGARFEVPIGDTSWSNDAVVELAFAPSAEAPPSNPLSKDAAP
jgi:hypothetical protein